MLLREVLASHDSSVVPLDARQADFVQVVCKFILVIAFCSSVIQSLQVLAFVTHIFL
jgi:hypothetical protein